MEYFLPCKYEFDDICTFLLWNWIDMGNYLATLSVES